MEEDVGSESNILALPSLIVSSQILSNLTADDRKALRESCKAIRVVVNGEVQEVRISACHIATGSPRLTLERVSSDFPRLEVLGLLDTPRNHINGPLLADFVARVADSQAAPGAAIRELDIKQCHFMTASDIQALLMACPRLNKLSTSRWADGAHLQALQNFGEHITELDLGDATTNISSITDKSLAHLPRLPALQSLSLRRCISITDEGVAHLGAPRLPSLTHLDLSFTRVAGASGFSGLHLKSLVLRGCRAFGDVGLATVCGTQASTLRSLSLYDTSIQPSGNSLWHLAQATALERLDLGAAWEVDREGLAALACCSALSELRLGNFNLRPVHAAAAAAAAANALQQDQPAVAAAAVWAAEPSNAAAAAVGGGQAGPLPSLTHLSLGGMFCQHGLDQLLPRLGRLRTLELTGLSTARDEVLGMLGGAAAGAAAAGGAGAVGGRPAAASALEDLRLLYGGPDLTPAGLLHLSRLPALRRLTLVGCPCATEDAVRQLLNAVRKNTAATNGNSNNDNSSHYTGKTVVAGTGGGAGEGAVPRELVRSRRYDRGVLQEEEDSEVDWGRQQHRRRRRLQVVVLGGKAGRLRADPLVAGHGLGGGGGSGGKGRSQGASVLPDDVVMMEAGL